MGDVQQAAGDTETLWIASSCARSGLLLATAAFGAHVKAGVRDLGCCSLDLALATAASCDALMPDAWPAGAADDLLGMAGLTDALLRVASSTTASHGFAVLRARRAAGELLAALLEAATPAWRQLVEAGLLRDAAHGPHMQALVTALLGGAPDPRLHEVLFELLWRALRRAGTGMALSALAAAHPALALLEQRRAGLCARIQSLTPEDLLEDAQLLALELSCDGEPTVFACQLPAVGGKAVAVFSAHAIAFHREGESQAALEAPWEAVDGHELRTAFGGCLLHLALDVDALRKLTGLASEVALPTSLELSFQATCNELQKALEMRLCNLRDERTPSYGPAGGQAPWPGLAPTISLQVNGVAPTRGPVGYVHGIPQRRPPLSFDAQGAVMQGQPAAQLPQVPCRYSAPAGPSLEAAPPLRSGFGNVPFLFNAGSSHSVPQRSHEGSHYIHDGQTAPSIGHCSTWGQVVPCRAPPARPTAPPPPPEAERTMAAAEVVSVSDAEGSPAPAHWATAANSSAAVPGKAAVAAATEAEAGRRVQDKEVPRPVGPPITFTPEEAQGDARADEATPARPKAPAAPSCALSQPKMAPAERRRSGRLAEKQAQAPAGVRARQSATHDADAANLLKQLFHGSDSAQSGPASQLSKPRQRGYSALATCTLRSLCRARGLPSNGERSELLRHLDAPLMPVVPPTLPAGPPPSQPQGRKKAAAGAVEAVRSGTAAAATVKAAGPRDAVSRVLQDAARLAREVADVQRAFQQTKRAVDEGSSKVNGLLDSIAGAAASPRKRGRMALAPAGCSAAVAAQ
eukprot:gnl/TRDRNA2_/TRDRNA2_167246_c0_seq1.p1 gnl/TRDRNA2_/TRDRNA2_167246_c0~~gnl/TRDRNA2_/TRDRNA2_167246_c0_seq1.p1  ORF type:complete len:880 (+),score=170.90 gnl/TRDRNA2_/TRDRNA2_167246_c0_seq1:233-2641(+)